MGTADKKSYVYWVSIDRNQIRAHGKLISSIKNWLLSALFVPTEGVVITAWAQFWERFYVASYGKFKSAEEQK